MGLVYVAKARAPPPSQSEGETRAHEGWSNRAGKGRDGREGKSEDRLGRIIRKRKVELSKRTETKDEKSKDLGSEKLSMQVK